MNCNLLKSKRVLKGITQKELANFIGISEKSYNQKECGKSTLKIRELELISLKLELSIDEINDIFFDKNLPNR